MKNPVFSIEISRKRRPGHVNNMNLSYPELLGTPGTGCIVKPDNVEMLNPARKAQSFQGSNKLYELNRTASAGGSMFGLIYERDEGDIDLDRTGRLLSSPGALLQSRYFIQTPGQRRASCPNLRPPAAAAHAHPPLIATPGSHRKPAASPVVYPKSPRPDGVAPAAEIEKFTNQKLKAKERSANRPFSRSGQYSRDGFQKVRVLTRAEIMKTTAQKPDVLFINHS